MFKYPHILILPTETFSGNQTWDYILRNPNRKSIYRQSGVNTRLFAYPL